MVQALARIGDAELRPRSFSIRACSLLRPLLIEAHHEKSSGWRRQTSGSDSPFAALDRPRTAGFDGWHWRRYACKDVHWNL